MEHLWAEEKPRRLGVGFTWCRRCYRTKLEAIHGTDGQGNPEIIECAGEDGRRRSRPPKGCSPGG